MSEEKSTLERYPALALNDKELLSEIFKTLSATETPSAYADDGRFAASIKDFL